MSTKLVHNEPTVKITGAQIRAARGLLGISAAALAQGAGVTWKTVQRFESHEGIPPSRSGTLGKVQQYLKARGIEFLGDPVASPGVRLHRPP